MKKKSWKCVVLVGMVAVTGCATAPPGPTAQVMPPPSKPLGMFRADDAACRKYVAGIVQPDIDAANKQMAGQIIIGALAGAALGAAIGNGAGQAIAAGAAAGSIVGTAAAAGTTAWSQLTVQQQYDIAYSQCMYSRGNQVPGYVQRYALPPPPPPPPSTPHNN